MWRSTQISGEALAAAARNYVYRNTNEPGGWQQAVQGFWYKTGPYIAGSEVGFKFSSFLALFIRIAVMIGTGLLPVIVRKVAAAARNDTNDPGGVDALVDALAHFDRTDVILAAAAVVLAGLPKVLDMLSRAKQRELSQTSYSDLAAALEKMPPLGVPEDLTNLGQSQSIDDALRFCLNALRSEIADLIGDEKLRRLTDVTLLEFCDAQGTHIQVRARTANEPVKRPHPSASFLAYYVGMQGRWCALHDFMSRKNPFPKIRLTVQGNMRANYRSVLYLPMYVSSRQEGAALPGGVQGAPAPQVVDYCIGVICVHSQKAFRFWRWGDHAKVSGGLGDIAYQRSLPYIGLITRLIERSAPRVKLEVL